MKGVETENQQPQADSSPNDRAGTTNLYIKRHLHSGERPVEEDIAFKQSEVTIVLAEPGAGKTELLGSVAKRLGTKPSRASVFRHSTTEIHGPILIIDALDEVARQGDSAFDQVIVKASECAATTVILSARSDVWPSQRTTFVKECFGREPKILYLRPFDEKEQKRLFEAHFPDEPFGLFLHAVSTFGLEPLLGNPMFLKLFAEGYLQLGRSFTSKAEVFHKAIARLAGGDGKQVASVTTPSINQIIQKSNEVFAKLLLCGASGISTVELLDQRDFPYLSDFSEMEKTLLPSVVNTRLFLPSDMADQHVPVHRIVAEYCAAQYLSKRIDDATDPLSLARCLAIIAPNRVIREDLRGLAGWMAALGDKHIQEALIEIDPYAVLANGDPAMLLASSKSKLISGLKRVAEADPYFRRLDGWRRFSVSGFFDQSTVPLVKDILQTAKEGSHLRELVLELLKDSDINSYLIDELRTIFLDDQSGWRIREHARQVLSTVTSYDHVTDVEKLVSLCTFDSFQLVVRFQTQPPTRKLPQNSILTFLEFAGSDNSIVKNDRGQKVDLKFSLKGLIATFSLEETEHNLDLLTAALDCTCSPTRPNMCSCKRRRSKVIGSLLDRRLQISNCTPERLWGWIKKLYFNSHTGSVDSVAVKKLNEDNELRRSVHRLALSGLTGPDEIWDMLVLLRWGNLHAGLAFSREDIEFHTDEAFARNNVALWSRLIWPHDPYSKRTEPDTLIQLWKRHARQKPEFLKVWSWVNRGWRQSFQNHRKTYSSRRKWRRKENRAKAKNQEVLQLDREQIETGRRWSWTEHFAHCFLHFPDELHDIDDGKGTVERTLYNSLEPLMEHMPSVTELAAGEKQNIVRMLHAVAIVHFRKHGNFDHWPRDALLALKTEVSDAKAYAKGEPKKLEAAIDEKIFKSTLDIETFCRCWFQPRLHANYDTLWQFRHKKCYAAVRHYLAREWLEKQAASIETTKTLFAICAEVDDHDFLRSQIEGRCDELLSDLSLADGLEDRRKFWFTSHFFFMQSDPKGIWATLLTLPEAVFLLERRVGRLERDEKIAWPKLNARKILMAMEVLVPKWPKVSLPNSWGSDSPAGETAYRFLCDLVYRIGEDEPGRAISVINEMLVNPVFDDFDATLKSMRASVVSKLALQDFKVPVLSSVVEILDRSQIATVEDMRALLLEELDRIQTWLRGNSTNPRAVFWSGGKRVDENTARNRIVEWLEPRLKAQDSAIVIEHHMADEKRCDFTVSKQRQGKRILLVCEVKGQWHAELFTAAESQLERQYAIHPDAAKQGVYLVFWFGPQIDVAGKSKHTVKDAVALKSEIVNTLPSHLKGLIDVYVLDVSLN
jgi:hypothetical protein